MDNAHNTDHSVGMCSIRDRSSDDILLVIGVMAAGKKEIEVMEIEVMARLSCRHERRSCRRPLEADERKIA